MFPQTSPFRRLACFACALLALLALLLGGETSPAQAAEWRLRVRDAAVVASSTVTLGDIADPVGTMSAAEWQQLAVLPLWPAPEVPGKPLQINKQRLAEALAQSLGPALADTCLLPNSLAIQLGGSVLREDDLRGLVMRTLTPSIELLGGHGDLTDYKLPAYAFLTPGQQVVLENPKLTPGRVTLRFEVQEIDGASVRRFSGSVFLNLWLDLPCAAKPLNKGDVLSPESVTFASRNLAYLKGEPWDGRGGPWQLTRSVGTEQPIMSNDLAPMSMVRKGNKINLIYSKGSVQISVLVEALEDGGPGDTIAVRNIESKKQVYATVRDANTVITK